MRHAVYEAVAHGVNKHQSTASIKLKMISHIFLHIVLFYSAVHFGSGQFMSVWTRLRWNINTQLCVGSCTPRPTGCSWSLHQHKLLPESSAKSKTCSSRLSNRSKPNQDSAKMCMSDGNPPWQSWAQWEQALPTWPSLTLPQPSGCLG